MDQFYPYEDILKGMHTRGKPPESGGDLMGAARMLHPAQAKMMHGVKQPATQGIRTSAFNFSRT